MTKTMKATLTALIALIAVAAFVAISYLIIPRWVTDVAASLSLLSFLIYGLSKYFAWCWAYWRRWRRLGGGDAAGEV